MLADDHSVKETALPKEKFEQAESRPAASTRGVAEHLSQLDRCLSRRAAQDYSQLRERRPFEMLMLGNIATLFPAETPFAKVPGEWSSD